MASPATTSAPDHDRVRSSPPQLDELAALACTATQQNLIVDGLVRSIMSLSGVTGVRIWLGSELESLVEAGCFGRWRGGDSESAAAPSLSDLCAAAMAENRQVTGWAAEESSPQEVARSSAASELWVVTPIKSHERLFGLVFAARSGSALREPEAVSCAQIQRTVDAVVPLFARQLTRELLAERDFDLRFRDFCRELHVEPSPSTTAAIVANEYRRLFQADRVWVLPASGRSFRVQAVSGVPGFQRRAEVVRRLQDLTSRACQTRQSFAWSAGETSAVTPRVAKSLDRYLDEAHVVQLRVEPIYAEERGQETSSKKSSSKVVAAIVCEWFTPVERPSGEIPWAAARQQTSLALQSAADWSRAPLARSLRSVRRHVNVPKFFSWSLAAVIVSVVAAALAMMPIDYTVEAVGELQPARQRHIFATAAGIVRELSVATSDEVSAGQKLLALEDSELELEIRRVEGELQTTQRRVAALEASRLNQQATTAETVGQMNTLTGDLSEQLQRKENLQQELEQLAFRREQLVLASPIAGQVVTWDLDRLLTRRPVVRGQRLMTVADTRGPWQVELRVSDEDSHEVCDVLRSDQTAALDFIIVTMPGIVRSTQVREISESVEIRSPGEGPTLLCLGEVPEEVASVAVTGLGVRGRIHCGRKPAIVVGCRSLWRAIQQHVLFPWGL